MNQKSIHDKPQDKTGHEYRSRAKEISKANANEYQEFLTMENNSKHKNLKTANKGYMTIFTQVLAGEAYHQSVLQSYT